MSSLFKFSRGSDFEAALAAAIAEPQPHAARSLVDAVVAEFVTSLPPGHPIKASRLAALLDCPFFTANTEIPSQASRDLGSSGLPLHSQRPMAYAICQFLNSNGSLHWRDAIVELAASSQFSAIFDQPLLFVKVEMVGGTREDPIIHHRSIAAFAHNFLRQEAGVAAEAGFPNIEAAFSALSDEIEQMMPPEAKAAAAKEEFILKSFGFLATSTDAERELVKAARLPIKPRSKAMP